MPALLLLLAACESPHGDDKPAYAPRPVVPRDAAVVPDAPPAPPPPTLRDAFRAITAGDGPPRVCFAVSKNRRRAACAVASWSNQAGNTQTITIVGDVGDAQSEWTYHSLEGMNDGPEHGGAPTALTAPAELDAAREALVARGYVLLADPPVPLVNHATVTFGPWTFRRERITTHEVVPWKPGDPEGQSDWNTYEEHLDVRCGKDRWVPTGIDNITYDEPWIWVSRLNERIALIELESWWGIEGESGGARTALALDVAALCAANP